VPPGHCLPSVRQLARELAVNANTVVRVYERLAAEGLVELRHGEGTFVAPPSADAQVASELAQQREQYARDFEAVVRRGLLLGYTMPALRGLLTAAGSAAKSQISQETRSEGST
jgi:GntR family transcriptional regulator